MSRDVLPSAIFLHIFDYIVQTLAFVWIEVRFARMRLAFGLLIQIPVGMSNERPAIVAYTI
jgi:hypothetical protein